MHRGGEAGHASSNAGKDRVLQGNMLALKLALLRPSAREEGMEIGGLATRRSTFDNCKCESILFD